MEIFTFILFESAREVITSIFVSKGKGCSKNNRLPNSRKEGLRNKGVQT